MYQWTCKTLINWFKNTIMANSLPIFVVYYDLVGSSNTQLLLYVTNSVTTIVTIKNKFLIHDDSEKYVYYKEFLWNTCINLPVFLKMSKPHHCS